MIFCQKWIALSLLLVFGGQASAVSDARRGGFALLNEPVGGRAAAMGGAATALTDDQTATHANPAAAALMSRKDFVLTHHSSFADIRQFHAGWAFGNGRRGTGLSVGLHMAGDFETRTGPSAEPIGTFHLFELNASWTYAQTMTPDLSAGFSVHLLHEDIASERASGLGLDFGALYRPGRRGLTFGGSIRNLGRMEGLDRERVPLPREVRFGASLDRRRLLVLAEARLQSHGNDGLHFGAELRPFPSLAVRGGYVSNVDARDVTFGFGLSKGGWRIDYAFVPSSLGLGDSHRISVGIR